MNNLIVGRRPTFQLGLFCIGLLLGTALQAAQPAADSTTDLTALRTAGAAITLLPSGQWLVTGGKFSGDVSSEVSIGSSIADSASLAQQPGLDLAVAREGHTATVLPDGTVFVFGGAGIDGALVNEAELIDVQSGTSAVLSIPELAGRANHTATLLTDGRVLIAGGVGGNGQPISQAQLWDPTTNAVEQWAPPMVVPRSGHQAELLPNGEGLMTGGSTGIRGVAPAPELFDPISNSFILAGSGELAPSADSPPKVVESIPGNDAQDVSGTSRIAIRFSEPLTIGQLNSANVTLIGPLGPVQGKVSGAEAGRLAFFTPSAELSPGARFTLFVGGASNAAGAVLPLTGITFTTHRYTAAPPRQVTSTSGNAGPQSTVPAAAANSAPAGARIAGSASKAPVRAAQKAATPPTSDPAVTADPTEDWIPQEANRHGNWSVGGLAGDPPFESSPLSISDLAAAPGQTAVAGHLLRFNGLPLAGATLSIGTQSTVTDSQGRFLLRGVGAGMQRLKIDGTGVSSKGRSYTKHFMQVSVQAGRTTTLPNPIFLARVNPAADIPISSPADHEIVLTHPDIPGLEVHIPKGAVLRDFDGHIITHLSITPIPVNRPPYPTPIRFSVYFTLQPGGAYVEGDPKLAVQIVYPNYSHLAPGTSVNFYNYDPNAGGWSVYGKGVVTADGKQVVPNSGVGFRQLMAFGNGIGNDIVPPASAPAPGNNCDCVGDPVDPGTGLFVETETDLSVNDIIPISITRTYRQSDSNIHSLGYGQTLQYSMYLYTPDLGSETDVYLILPDGGQIHYTRLSNTPAVWENLDSPTSFYGSYLTQATADTDFVITKTDHSTLTFLHSQPNPLVSITDRNGNTVSFIYTNNNDYILTQIISPSGRYINLTWSTVLDYYVITGASDDLGHSVSYQYDTSGRLHIYTDAAGKTETYNYDSSNRMSSIIDKRGNTRVTNTYDANNRVKTQTLADSALWQFAYSLNANGTVAQATVTDPNNSITQDTFNASGYLTQQILGQGSSVQQTLTTNRLAGTNQVYSQTDALGRTATYTYDTYGNVIQLAFYNLVSTENAYFTYDPIFQQLLTYQNFAGYTTTLGYDTLGNLTSVTNPLGNKWTLGNNSRGLPTSVTDPLSHTIGFGYALADLSSVTDGVGDVTHLYTDVLGRVQTVTDPLGNTSQVAYDALDRVTGVTNALGASTGITYDQNSNVLTFHDARNAGTHTFTYDSRNRVHTYQDPIGHTATYTYDGVGNLKTKLDRKNQLTQYAYDALNRLSTVTYADNSTVGITWDAGNRPTKIVDSVNGTLTRTFDGLDDLTREVSPQGQINYQYDGLGRRSQMTVTGQTLISYTFDKANRLTNIAQGSTAVVIGYDTANRRSTVTLPNGVLETYGYDAANRLTSITYTYGSTQLGTLAYGYDAAGRRITQSGTWARMTYPTNAAMTYNAANQQSTWGSSAETFDNNGNLTGFGSTTYTWNTRDQLTATSDGTSTFAYDPVGRQVTDTVSGVAKAYLYDGWNPATVNATTLIYGVGLDDVFARAGSSAASISTDGIGSVIAHTGTSGTTLDTYTYDPYGNSTHSGTDTSQLEYTGLENLGASNLIYSRNRYLKPETGRFISQDPAGFAGGDNLYAYVGGNPISNIDPLGLAQFGYRPLSGLPWLGIFSRNPLDDFLNTDLAHEQLFFEDSRSPSNVGFFPNGLQSGEDPSQYHMDPTHYDDAIMRQAVANIDPGHYNLGSNNCQTYGAKLRNEYNRLLKSPLFASPQ